MGSMSKTTFLVLALAGAAAIYILWRKSRAASAAVQSTDISNPIARGARGVATTSGSYLNKVPVVGEYVDKALNGPVIDVTSGNVKGTIYSATSGGLSDWAPSVSKYVDPVEWFSW